MHTLGRTRAEAHRDFRRQVREERMDTDLLEAHGRPSPTGMRVIQAYFDGAVADSPYLHWMGRFASIFQLASTGYMTMSKLFQAIGRSNKDFELEGVHSTPVLRRTSGGRGSTHLPSPGPWGSAPASSCASWSGRG